MNHPSDAVLPSHVPAGGEPGPVISRRSWLRLLAWSAASIVFALAVVCAYALVYPERMPPAVGSIVEDITGASIGRIK
jgi:cytochrome c peroxidase